MNPTIAPPPSPAPPAPPKKLTGPERMVLKDCEFRIERGLKAFYEVGASLLEIRNQKLYREHFNTFEEYCQERWSFSSSRARQLIDGAQVVERVKSVTTVTPANEAIARELNRLPKDQQSACWSDYLADCEKCGLKPTSGGLKGMVDLWIADNEPYRPADHDDHDHDDEALDQHVANLVGVPVETIRQAEKIDKADRAVGDRVLKGEITLDDATAILDGRDVDADAAAVDGLQLSKRNMQRTKETAIARINADKNQAVLLVRDKVRHCEQLAKEAREHLSDGPRGIPDAQMILDELVNQLWQLGDDLSPRDEEPAA